MAGDVHMKTVTFACNTTNGNQVISVPGVTDVPKCVSFVIVGATADDTFRNHSGIGIGAATGAASQEQGLFANCNQDGAGSSNTENYHSATHCAGFLDFTTAFTPYTASFVSFGAGSVTINWDAAPPYAALGQMTVAYGADLQAECRFNNPSNVGTSPFTVPVGIPYTALLIVACDFDGRGLEHQGSNAYFSISSILPGPTPTTPDSRMICMYQVDGQSVTRGRGWADSDLLGLVLYMGTTAGASRRFKCVETAHDGAGPWSYTLEREGGGNSTTREHLAIAVHTDNKQVAHGFIAAPTSTTGGDFVINTGWEPGFGFLTLTNFDTLDNFIRDGDRADNLSIAMTDFTNSQSAGIVVDDQQPPAAVATRYTNFVNTWARAGGLETCRMGPPQAEATGLRITQANIALAEPTTRYMNYLLFEKGDTGPAPTFVPAWAEGLDIGDGFGNAT